MIQMKKKRSLPCPVWLMPTLREVLDDFCADHDLQVRDELAIAAAKRLLEIVAPGNEQPSQLLVQLEEWFEKLAPDTFEPR